MEKIREVDEIIDRMKRDIDHYWGGLCTEQETINKITIGAVQALNVIGLDVDIY